MTKINAIKTRASMQRKSSNIAKFKPVRGKTEKIVILDDLHMRPYQAWRHSAPVKRNVVRKARAVGMSWSFAAAHSVCDGPDCPICKMFGDGKVVTRVCQECGYIYNWKDYTKYQRYPERDRKHLVNKCVRCGCKHWKIVEAKNPLDKVIAHMENQK